MIEAASSRPRKSDSGVRVFSRLAYKTETGLADGQRTHVWVVTAEGGLRTLLTEGDHDEYGVSWSPDGHHLAFVSDRSPNPDRDYRPAIWIKRSAKVRT